MTTYGSHIQRKSQLSLFSSKKVNQSKIIMKVLFLVAAIAVCLMTFAPATEASYRPSRRCCQYKRVCSNRGYKLHCRRVCVRYCPYPFKGYY
ncbi:hypothetical protein EB796_006332 [Bugula neritina]|uniref:Uncharacterized protein n=1 Tax=Bugula neritina TaxID=10212 RepID=A0A7J7KCV4_BUGNE|nr:hypothetical protein EB796_006332 [Bugula neritina]